MHESDSRSAISCENPPKFRCRVASSLSIPGFETARSVFLISDCWLFQRSTPPPLTFTWKRIGPHLEGSHMRHTPKRYVAFQTHVYKSPLKLTRCAEYLWDVRTLGLGRTSLKFACMPLKRFSMQNQVSCYLCVEKTYFLDDRWNS